MAPQITLISLSFIGCILTNNEHWSFKLNGAIQNTKVKGYWRSNNANVVLSACEQGLGIAYLPESTFTESIKCKKLVPVLQPFWSTGATSWIVYQNKQFLPLRAKLAIEFLLEHFTQWH